MDVDSLMRRYRMERRRLLEFVLSAGLAAEVWPPPGVESLSDVDLDRVSADYVLDRVKSGGVLDLSVASRRYQEELKFPVMITSRNGTKFFLSTKPKISGAPPNSTPPQPNKIFRQTSYTTKESYEAFFCKTQEEVHCSPTVLRHKNLISFGLPALASGLSDDDIRKTAYEVLMASAFAFGGQTYFHEVKRKETKSKFLPGLKTRKERTRAETRFVDGKSRIMDMIRVQMEISEGMDLFIKRGLMLFQSRFESDPLDVPQITLQLVISVSKSDFVNQKLFKQWQLKQINVLDELLSGPVNVFMSDEFTPLKLSMTKLRNISERNGEYVSGELTESLITIRKIASKLSHIPKKFGLPGESCYWTSSYHCHIRLYEMLLRSVFDILEDGQIVKESEELLTIFKLTWPVLGITQNLHDALYGHVLLQQYICTGETTLLSNAIIQIQRVISSEHISRNEEAYMNCLLCFNEDIEGNGELGLVQAVLSSITVWCNEKLQDYHLHFLQKHEHFVSTANLASVLMLYFGSERFESKIFMSKPAPEVIKGYIEGSISAVCRRVVESVGRESKIDGSHLVKLAEDLKLTAHTEFTIFTPVLRQWYPEAGVVSAVFLHKIYGKYLMPFLETVSDFSESSRSALTAAAIFEKYLSDMIYSCNEESVSNLVGDLQPYEIGRISRPLILHWLNSQHHKLLKWAQRTILIESWEPLSGQQRLAASIVDVFRIVEENVDRFFSFQLPMDIIHLRSLLIGIFQIIDTYLLRMRSSFVDKKHLYPSAPALTRYKEGKGLFPKKKPTEQVVFAENIRQSLNSLTASKFCIRLNTLRYIRVQLEVVEESIKKSWKQTHPGPDISTEELFTIFDDIRKMSYNMNDLICDFIGTRVIFWDLRDPFILSLYSGSVEHARIDLVIQQLDSILNQICDLVADTLRDQVILSICRASMEAFIWVVLDGGPSRAFFVEDIPMLHEDLNLLMDLFVASGDGLHRSVVERESKLIQQILQICLIKTDTIIEMMMSSSENINPKSDIVKPNKRQATDVDTLLRILCHRKDREASKFLKKHYHLPKSSDYAETMGKSEHISESPGIAGILMGSKAGSLTERGQRSFRGMKQRLEEATSEIRHNAHW